MPYYDIVNFNAKFILGNEESVLTTSIFKGTPCSILGVYTSNDFVLAREFIPYYKGLEGNKRGGFGGFIRDILIEDGLFGDDNSHRRDMSTLNQSGIKISVDPTVTYHFLKTCITFKSVQGIIRQKKCVMCVPEGRKK